MEPPAPVTNTFLFFIKSTTSLSLICLLSLPSKSSIFTSLIFFMLTFPSINSYIPGMVFILHFVFLQICIISRFLFLFIFAMVKIISSTFRFLAIVSISSVVPITGTL